MQTVDIRTLSDVLLEGQNTGLATKDETLYIFSDNFCIF